MPPKEYVRKKGFYCELTQDDITKNSIRLEDLHYDDLGKDGFTNKYFVYYDSVNKEESSKDVMDRLYSTVYMQHYANEHIDDMKWCQENKEFLQPLIKKDFDEKFGKYGEDFKFDLDIFNYAFLGSKEEMYISLNPNEKREKTALETVNEEIEGLMESAAAENTELDLKGAINKVGKRLEGMEHVASQIGCQRAMKLAMANYAHKIMKLDISKDKKKELFGDILLSYKDTMTTMLATIGGYDKDYNVGNIDFGCLEANDLMKDLNEVVPTEFFIDVNKDADKNKDLDTVIKNSYDNKKIAVEDKEFIGQTYKTVKENYAKHNGFIVFLSKLPLLYPSIKKERATIEKVEKFADKFDLGKTAKERINNLTGITSAKKNKVIADMADKFISSAQVDVNNLIKSMETVVGTNALTNGRLRTLSAVESKGINPTVNRFYAGKVLNKISELPGVDKYFKPIDKEDERAFTKNVKYQNNLKDISSKKLTEVEYKEIAGKYRDICDYLGRENAIVFFNEKNCVKDGKSVVFSLGKEVEKANAELERLNCDVAMNGYELEQKENLVQEQADFKDLSNLGKETNNSELSQQKDEKNLSAVHEVEKDKSIQDVVRQNV